MQEEIGLKGFAPEEAKKQTVGDTVQTHWSGRGH